METEKSKSLSYFIFFPLLLLIFIRPFFSGLAYPKLEIYYEITLILIAAIALIGLKKPARLPLATWQVEYGCILLLFAYIISTIHSININNSFRETLKFISFASIFFIISQFNDKQKNLLIKSIVIAGTIISLYAVYQYFWGYDRTISYLKNINSDFLKTSSYARDILLAKRAIGTFPSPNILGGYLIIVFFLGLRLKQDMRKILFLILIAAALLLTKSLGAWLSLITALIILFILSYESIKHKKTTLIICLAVISLAITFILITRWERLINLDNPQNSITQRLNYWRTAFAVIKTHPLLGVGPGNFHEVFLKYKVGFGTNTQYAHNIFLHTWAETGILGFMALIYLIITFFRSSNGNIPARRTERVYILLAGLAFLFHNLIDNTYFIPEAGFLWWVLLAVL